LSDLAQEKLKEINQAYDMLSTQNGGQRNSDRSYNGTGAGAGVEYAQIRDMIVRGNIQGAESALNAISGRNAEWYYLYGVVCLRKGWYDQARENMQRAVNMEPNNVEYRAGLNNINNMSFGYGRSYQRTGMQGNSGGLCNICATLWCADCCCECMGGDFIPCC